MTVGRSRAWLLLVLAAIMLAILMFTHQSAYAEGSRELMEDDHIPGDRTAYRPFLEWWETGDTGAIPGIQRKTLLRVYAKEGESILAGSSIHDSINDAGDITLRAPDGQVYPLDVVNNGQGFIASPATEAIGPQFTVGGATFNAGGYTPLEHVVGPGQAGEWLVEFRGRGSSGDPTKCPVAQQWTSATSGDCRQVNAAVAAWDITVIDRLDSANPEKPGRLFTYSLALNMGGQFNSSTVNNSQGLYSRVYVLTKDGFLYRTDMNGIDPYGFIFFSNNRGFIDLTNQQTVYHSVPLLGPGSGTGTIPTRFNMGVQSPNDPDTDLGVTHRVFFNEPDPEISMFDIQTTPLLPPDIEEFAFADSDSGAPIVQTGNGGVFRLSLDRSATFQIIIDTDTSDMVNNVPTFDPSKDTVIENSVAPGETMVPWDGKDRFGVAVPVGTYQAKLLIKGGEYHFPMIDVENAYHGIVIEMLNVPGTLPVDIKPTTIYYNDENYSTANGEYVCLDNQAGSDGVCQGSATAPDPRNASIGEDSANGAHKFYGSYGNNRAIDTWTFFPGSEEVLTFYVTDSSVSGTVFLDENRDGTQDGGELGIAGIDVNIKDPVTDVTHTVTTDAAGNYTMPINPGSVEITIIQANNLPLRGFVATTGAFPRSVIVSSSGHPVENFGYAPFIEITSPANGALTKDNTPLVTGTTTSPNQPVTIYVGGDTLGTVTSDGSGNWSYTIDDDDALIDGEHTIRAVALYNGENVEASVTITVDTTVNVVIGAPEHNELINTRTPEITGTTDDAGNTVTLTIENSGGTVIIGPVEVTVNTDGTWSHPVSSELVDGTYTVKVTAEDPAGNEANGTQPFTVDATIAVDIVAPADGSTTNDRTPEITGTTDEADNTVTLTIRDSANNVVTGLSNVAVTVGTGGAWSYTVPEAYKLDEGEYTVSVTATDAAGNVDADAHTFTVAVNVAVEIDEPADHARINDRTPEITGTTDDAGNTVTLTIENSGGTVIVGPVEVTVDTDGTWSYPVSSELVDGTYTVRVTAEDSADNEASDAHSFTVDGTIAVDIVAPADGSITNDRTPEITGTTDEADNTVTLTIRDSANNVVTGLSNVAVTVGTGGAWSYTVPEAYKLDEGEYTVSVTATDAAGNVDADAHTFTVAVNVAVEIDEPADHARINDRTPEITGTTDDAGNTVTLTIENSGGTVIVGPVEVTVDTDGTWSYPVSSELVDGTYTVRVTAEDSADNEASDAHSFTVDGTIAVDIVAPADGSITNDRTPEITGTTDEADNTVTLTIRDSANNVVTGLSNVAVTVGAGGAWSYTVPEAYKLNEGEYTVSVTATDAAGNVDADAHTFTVAINVAISIAVPEDGSIINDTTPTVTGSTYDSAGTVVLTIVDWNNVPVISNEPVATDGAWSYTVPNGSELADGNYTVTVTTTDASGNLAEDAHTFTIDSFIEVDIIEPADNSVTGSQPTFAGTTDDGGNQVALTVVRKDTLQPVSGLENVAAQVNTDGTWSYDVTGLHLPDGTYTVTANATDAAGNTDADTHEFIVDMLDGWVGSRAQHDLTPVVAAPGSALKLSVVASALADQVSVVVLPGETPAQLVKVGDTGSYSLWESVTYRLPDSAATGEYTIAVTAYSGGHAMVPELATKLDNNKFHVVRTVDLEGTVTVQDGGAIIADAKVTLFDLAGTSVAKDDNGQQLTTTTDANGQYFFDNIRTKTYLVVVEKAGYSTVKRVVNTLPATPTQQTITEDFEMVNFHIELTASPTSIVGDGVSRTWLTAVVTDRNGQPIPNIEVEFHAPIGSFPAVPDGKVTTDPSGTARLQYQSVQIEGIVSQSIPVTATVDDPASGLYDWKQIHITFEPASVNGVVTNVVNGQTVPVAGAIIKLTKDFDNDGIIDFSAEAVSDANGYYSIAVPRGNTVYDVEIIKPVMVGDTEHQVSFRQKADVNVPVTGTGQSFHSAKTSTGIVMLKDPEGQTELFRDEVLSEFRVYLKDTSPGGAYLVNPATGESWFPLEGTGVFSAENLDPSKEYQLEIKYVITINDPNHPRNGQTEEIIFNQQPVLDGQGRPVTDSSKQKLFEYPIVKVTEDGELNILEMLVDPYGDVRNSKTNALISGAKVTLYYTDNDEEVHLPVLAGFEPFNNQSPTQTTEAIGKYAFMVYPETDYYLIVEARGYRKYRSPNIRVDWDIVRHDVWMTPIPADDPVEEGEANPEEAANPEEGANPGTGSGTPNLVINVDIDRSVYEEGVDIPVTVTYSNNGNANAADGEVRVTLPEGAIVVDAGGGVVRDGEIVWSGIDLKQGGLQQRRIVIRFADQEQAERLVDIVATLAAGGQQAGADASKAGVKLMIFSNRHGHIEHDRYILGYPDFTFGPDKPLLRSELAAIVARLLGGGEERPLVYTDVPKNHWAYRYIGIVTEHGVFSGDPTGKFRPSDPVTREELASVMMRFLGLTAGETIRPHFADVQGRWSSAAIEALYRNKLVTGYPDGTFKPGAGIKRLEAVVLINSMLYRGPLAGIEPLFPDVPTTSWGFGHAMEATVSHEATRNTDGSEQFMRQIEDQVD